MLKKLAMLTTVCLLAGLLVVPAVMAECCICTNPDCADEQHQFQCRSRNSQYSQNGPMKHVAPDYCTIYLYEKDATTWNVIGDGGAAMLKCLPEANYFHFMLHAIKLLPETSYTLIYYPDPWPGAGLICLGSGTTDSSGYLHIKTFGNHANYTPPVSTGNMPKDYDYNFGYGAKIWLVPSADVNCAAQTMTAWNPEQYLFEIYLISFVDSDGE